MEGNLLREWPAMYGHVRRVEIEETPYIHFMFLYEHIARRIRSVRRSKPPHSKASARRNREGAKLFKSPARQRQAMGRRPGVCPLHSVGGECEKGSGWSSGVRRSSSSTA